jgi:hypothetical protein
MNAMNVPITFEPEAAQRIAQLGFENPVEQMIDYARQNLPNLVRIEVLLNIRYEEPDSEDGVFIQAWCVGQYDPADPTTGELDRWVISTFPPQVLEHLCIDRYWEG